MKTCETCRWWDRSWLLGGNRPCRRIEDTGYGFVYIALGDPHDSASLMTPPTFGCVLWTETSTGPAKTLWGIPVVVVEGLPRQTIVLSNEEPFFDDQEDSDR